MNYFFLYKLIHASQLINDSLDQFKLITLGETIMHPPLITINVVQSLWL